MNDGDLKTVPVLMSAWLSDHARNRLQDTFNAVAIDEANPALVSAALAGKIRGVAWTGKLPAVMMTALPRLEMVANFGVGYDGIDVAHAAGNDIMVTNTPDVLSEEVADTTIGLLLNVVRELSAAERHLRDGAWAKDIDYRLTPLTMRGRSIGIFGLGRIGLAIAKRLEAFGVSIAYHNRREVAAVAYPYYDTLIGLAAAVDTLIVVVPGGAATRKAVNADVLAALGSKGVLINMGRGSIVDEDALIKALHAGTIAAAGLDVFENEPVIRQDFLTTPNLVLLPHVGSASEHTRRAMADLCVDNLISWFSGKGALTPVAETSRLQPASRSG